MSPTGQTRHPIKSTDEPLDPHKTVDARLDLTQSGRLRFQRKWLADRSPEDLIQLIADLALELKGRKVEATEQIASPLTSVTFEDIKAEDVKKYTRLPEKSDKTADQLAATTWRIILVSDRKEHAPQGLEICDDVTIGRTVSGIIKSDLDLTDVGGEDLGVSRKHALLVPTADKLKLVDLGSTNGTFVEGEELITGKPRSLQDGNILSFGGLHFRLKIVRQPPAAKP